MYILFIFIKRYFGTETVAVCDRSKSSYGGFLIFIISYACYISEKCVYVYVHVCIIFFILVT